jgi:hypothetical protein
MQAQKRVGWWRFEIDVPRDWDIVAQGKSRDAEVFRLADSASVRLEVLLEKTPFEKAKGADELLESYKKSWERRLGDLKKREGVEAELKHAFKERVEVCGHKGVLWGFRVGGALMIAALWYCEKSERSVALTFTPRSLDEKDSFLAMLKSCKCHYASASEKALWSLLLFDVRLPQKYDLAAAKFTTLSSFCTFEDPEGGEYLVVGYSGLATAILERYKKGLREWFEKNILKEAFRNLHVEIPKIKYEESEDALSYRGETFSFIKSKRKVLIGRIWHDKRIDRILANGVYFPSSKIEEAKELLEELTEQMKIVALL